MQATIQKQIQTRNWLGFSKFALKQTVADRQSPQGDRLLNEQRSQRARRADRGSQGRRHSGRALGSGRDHDVIFPSKRPALNDTKSTSDPPNGPVFQTLFALHNSSFLLDHWPTAEILWTQESKKPGSLGKQVALTEGKLFNPDTKPGKNRFPLKENQRRSPR